MNIQHVFDLAVNQLVQLTVLIAAAGLVASLLVRRRSHLAYILWLAVLIKSLTPPVWSSPLGVFSYRQNVSHARVERTAMVFEGSAPLPMTTSRASVVQSQPLPASHSWTIAGLMLGAWAIGCAGFALIVAIRWIVLQRRIARSSVQPPRELFELLEQLREQLGVRRQIGLRVCDDPIGPAMVGLVRPTLVIPAAILRNKTAAQLRPLLAHEIIHLRRGDPLVAGLQLVSQAMWWFNPLVWWMNRQMIRAREICCDAEVIAGLECPREGYAQMLIDVLRLRRSVGAFVAWPGIRTVHITVRRLDQIMTDDAALRRTPRRYWALLAVSVLVLLPGAAMSDDSPQAPSPSSSDTNATTGTVASSDDPGAENLPPAVVKSEYRKTLAEIDEMEKSGDADQNQQLVYLKTKLTELQREMDVQSSMAMPATPSGQNLTIRHFVAIVVDTNGIRFRGQPTSIDQLSETLAKIPDRPHTVLELGYANGDVTMGQFNEVQGRAMELVNQLGFEYLSLTGQHPADYKGAPDQVVVQNLPEAPHILPALTPMPADFLTHVIPVRVGQTWFKGDEGDNITITEVRSDRDQFEVDGTYQVKGTYALVSHDHATISISLSAKDPKNARGYTNQAQSMDIHRGVGTFTVTERFACEGYPHVSIATPEGKLCDIYFGWRGWILK